MNHFLDLASCGRDPGASSGELRARRLAEAIAANAHGLDDEAVAGLHTFVDLAVRTPNTARDLIEG